MLLQTIVLAVVQGLTEFLPISSSGHLVLLEWVWGIDELPLAFDVALHVGSLLALLVYFRRMWWEICLGIVERERRTERYQLFLLFIGTVPVVIAGIFLKERMEQVQSAVFVAGAMVLVGCVFILTEYVHKHRYDSRPGMLKKDFSAFSWKQSLLVGVFQCFGLLPGVSRSGITTVGGMWQGVSRAEAARFSFLLGTPAIVGAALVTGVDLLQDMALIEGMLGYILVGILVSAVTSFFAIAFMLRLFQTQRLSVFAYYLFALGGVVMVL